MSYRPDQRQVPSQIMTKAGWLQGTLHVPRASKLVMHLNAQPEFVRVTDVSFAGKPHRVPFMSMQRKLMVLLAPSPDETDLSVEDASLPPQRVFVLLEGGVLAGDLRLRPGVRTSDFFAKQQGFVLLRDCVLRLGDSNASILVEERHPAVLMNASQIIAVAESDPLGSGA